MPRLLEGAGKAGYNKKMSFPLLLQGVAHAGIS